MLRPADEKGGYSPSPSIVTPDYPSLSTFSLSSWIPGARGRSRSASTQKIDAAGGTSAQLSELQLAVMINLPSKKRPATPDGDVPADGPPDCQFGIIHVPWEGDKTATSPVPR
jgi:hypothetical protein